MLEIERLTVRFGGLEALADLDLTLAPGAALGLIGPNGSGKTTLFNAISGIVQPAAGRIMFQGRDLVGRAPYQIARAGIARTFQTVRVFQRMTVRDNVRSASTDKGKAVDALLSRVGLATLEDTLAGELPLMEQRRLEIARVLAHQPCLVLLDEPSGGLSPGETEEMIQLLKEVVLPAAATILIEHKLALIEALCPRAALLVQGRKAAEAAPADLLRHPTLQETYLGVR